MWNKHRKLWVVFAVLIVNTIMLMAVIGYNKRNTSTSDNQIQSVKIYTEEDYLAFADSVDEENNFEHYEIILYNDLDFSGYEDFPVIGAMEDESQNISFKGTFEGNGHVIKGIHLYKSGETAALFAKLDGIVKNLRIEDSSFQGSLCGAIAAEIYEGSILNCYVDAETEGDIAGTVAGENYNGVISNCVASSNIVGKNEYGTISYCYLKGEENIEDLNNNLYHLSGSYADASFCCWKATEKGILSTEKKDLLETLTARVTIDGQETKLQGYYSEGDKQWYFALPAAYGDAEAYIEATTSQGGFESFKRNSGEKEILFTWGEAAYLIGFQTTDDIETLYITLEKGKGLEYVHANKREQIPGRMMIIDKNGKVSYETVNSFYGHGNDSWAAKKKSYNLKLDSRADLLGMGENEDYVLLAGYRKNSMMSFCVTNELTKAVGFEYAPEYRLVNLYVDGEYVGVYFLTERIEIDENRIDIGSVYAKTKEVNSKSLDTFEHEAWGDDETSQRRHYYNVETNPEDITGGYLLELDFADYEELESRFTTKYKRSKIVLKRAWYSSEEQVNYIADFWQDFEDALFSEDGYNEKGKRYTDNIDLESFAMQWLMYELSMEDSMRSSIYFYKESDVTGDGLLHACYPWDMERSYIMLDRLEKLNNAGREDDYWSAFYEHQDFREEVSRVWQEKFIPILDFMTADEPLENETGIRNLRWYTYYMAEISQLEHSRWEKTDMLQKCEEIKDILKIRKEVLTSELVLE